MNINKAIFTASLIRLAAVLFCIEFVRSAFLISFLPAYAVNGLGISVAAVGLAVSIHYIADTAVKCVAGYMLDRFSPRLMIHAALGIAFLGLLAAYTSREAWQLVVGAALMGIGASPIWLMCLSRVREEQRASQMGTLYTVWLASLGAGPVAINFLLDRGFALSFWLLAGLWGTGWILASKWRSDSRPSIGKISVKEQLRALRGKLAAMKPLFPGMVLQTAAAGLLVPVLPSFASNYLGLNYSDYSFVLIVGGICTTVCLIPMGQLSDKWGYKWFLVAGFGILAIGLYLLLYSTHIYSTMLLAAMLGLSYAAVLPAWNALLSHFVPEEHKGMGWGVLSSIEGIGIMIGPSLGGWVANLYNETATVVVSAVLLAALSIFYLFFPRRYLVNKQLTLTQHPHS